MLAAMNATVQLTPNEAYSYPNLADNQESWASNSPSADMPYPLGMDIFSSGTFDLVKIWDTFTSDFGNEWLTIMMYMGGSPSVDAAAYNAAVGTLATGMGINPATHPVCYF